MKKELFLKNFTAEIAENAESVFTTKNAKGTKKYLIADTLGINYADLRSF